jgi:hypothetical protein
MPSESGQAGTIEEHEGRGVWVPKGMNVRDIMAGASALERQFEIAPYTARDMAIAVLQAAQPNPASRAETDEA